MAIDTESFDLLLASVQRFITERLMPAENAVEENDEVPADIVEASASTETCGCCACTKARRRSSN